MVSEIKLIIQNSNRTLEIVTTEVNRLNPSCLLQSLQKFQTDANEALTKLIADGCVDQTSCMRDESEGEEDDELEEEITVSPTKRKK